MRRCIHQPRRVRTFFGYVAAYYSRGPPAPTLGCWVLWLTIMVCLHTNMEATSKCDMAIPAHDDAVELGNVVQGQTNHFLSRGPVTWADGWVPPWPSLLPAPVLLCPSAMPCPKQLGGHPMEFMPPPPIAGPNHGTRRHSSSPLASPHPQVSAAFVSKWMQ